MFCPHCGAQLSDGAKFCTECGSATDGAAPAAVEPSIASESTPVPNGVAQPTPAPTSGPSRAARIAVVAAIVVVVAVVAGAIGCNAGRVSGGDSSPSPGSGTSVASLEPNSSESSNGPAGSDSAGSSGSADNGTASSSSGSAPSAAMTPAPSGKLVEYRSDNGGFGITIDDTFAVKDAGGEFIVFTAKEGVLPQYQIIWSRTPASGMTDEEIVENMMDIAVKNRGDRIITGPVTNSFQLSDGRTIRGIEYIYEANNGGRLARYEYYEDQANGFTYTWSGICDPDDTVTPKAMEVAMDSFHFLAS